MEHYGCGWLREASRHDPVHELVPQHRTTIFFQQRNTRNLGRAENLTPQEGLASPERAILHNELGVPAKDRLDHFEGRHIERFVHAAPEPAIEVAQRDLTRD